MKAKKKGHKLLLAVILLLVTIMIFLYFIKNFNGVVLKKYDQSGSFIDLPFVAHHVVIKNWYSTKDYIMPDDDEDDYNTIEVGKTYSFKGDLFDNIIEIKK